MPTKSENRLAMEAAEKRLKRLLKNRKAKSKGPSAASLKRIIAKLAADLAEMKERSDNNYDECMTARKQRDERRKERDDERGEVRRLEIECAELHGYINRVELEDDKAWYKRHGAKMPNSDGTLSTQPPLRQRLRGVRYDQQGSHDIYQTHGGRTNRHAG